MAVAGSPRPSLRSGTCHPAASAVLLLPLLQPCDDDVVRGDLAGAAAALEVQLELVQNRLHSRLGRSSLVSASGRGRTFHTGRRDGVAGPRGDAPGGLVPVTGSGRPRARSGELAARIFSVCKPIVNRCSPT